MPNTTLLKKPANKETETQPLKFFWELPKE